MCDEVECMVFYSDHKYCLQKLLLVICQFLSDEQSVIVSVFISVHVF